MRNVLSTCGVAGSFDLMLAYQKEQGQIVNLELSGLAELLAKPPRHALGEESARITTSSTTRDKAESWRP